MKPHAQVHAYRHRPPLTRGGPTWVYVFVPGKDRAKALCREATDAIVKAIPGAATVTRLTRCKGTRERSQGYARYVEVPDARVVGGLRAATATLLRRGWRVEVERDADVTCDATRRTHALGANWYTVTACPANAAHVRRVVRAGEAPCARCVAEPVPTVPLEDVTFRVEYLLTEALCEWLPLVLQGTPATVVRRVVTVEDARDYAMHLVAARDALPAADDEHDWQEASTALHEAAHACFALATCAAANVGRTRLLAETIRRANVIGALAARLHPTRYREAVQFARTNGLL